MRSAARAAAEALEERLALSAWYVAAYGANSNPGTIQQPFATIQQAATVAQPGDTVYIRGGTYHETVIPANSGTASAPITFEAYNNESVTIDGADPVAGWTLHAGDIYTATQLWNLGEGNNQVFLDGQMISESRFPETGANPSTPTWARATNITATVSTTGLSTATIYDPALTQPAGAWVGALAHIAAGQEWVDQVAPIIASEPGSITVQYQQETSYQVPQAGNRFYIVGTLQALTSAGEWNLNPTTNTLSLWTPKGNSPANHVVEAKARQYGFDLSGLSNINIQGINLFACTINTSSTSTNDVINGITATYVSQSTGVTQDTLDPWSAQYHPHTTGIILNGQNNTLENSTIAYSSGDGVFVGGSGNTVNNCIIHDTDYEAGDEAGITTLGSNELVEHNTIYNAGRSGIVSRYTYDSQIIYNSIHNVGLQMTDLGGIYTWDTNGQNTVIAYNDIYNIHCGGYGAAGIYLDNGSQNFIVDHNLVDGCDIALKLNPPSVDNTIFNNTLIGTQYSLESSGNQSMTGDELFNNIFTAKVMFGPGAMQSNNILPGTNPKFVNAGAGNYLLAAGSPAIGAGMTVMPRSVGASPTVDIGAFAYGKPGTVFGATPIESAATLPPATMPSNSWFAPESYALQSGTTAAGSGLVFSSASSWVEYSAINFGAGVSMLIANVSMLPTVDTRIQIYLDSMSNAPIGILTLPITGMPPSQAAQMLYVALTGVSGVHNVYLQLIDPPCGSILDGFTFK